MYVQRPSIYNFSTFIMMDMTMDKTYLIKADEWTLEAWGMTMMVLFLVV